MTGTATASPEFDPLHDTLRRFVPGYDRICPEPFNRQGEPD